MTYALACVRHWAGPLGAFGVVVEMSVAVVAVVVGSGINAARHRTTPLGVT